MDIQTFIDNYQETFSGKAELPIAFWYQHERRKHRLRRWEILYRIHSHAGTCT